MEEKPITIWAREALFTRSDRLPEALIDKILDKYHYRFYEEKACQSCEFLFERPGPMCEDCGANKGAAILSREIKVDGITYLKMPIGDADAALDLFDDFKIKYKLKADHPRAPIKRKITFTGELYDYQRTVVDVMHSERRGVIKAPPRSGKTVCGSAFICEVGEKAIILASQREWLLGFQETFIGSETQEAMTDCLPSQIGFCKKPSDFDKYDICLVTPQTFLRHPEWLDEVCEKASVVIVDEVRLSAAPKYAKVVAALNARHYIGLDGTPSRSKDGRYVLVENLIGPIIARPKVEFLSPKIKLIRTKFKRSYKMGVPWNKIVDDLEFDEERMKLIAKWAIMDANHNHMVLIPMLRVDAIKRLVNEINHQAGEIIAKPFTGDLPRKKRDATLQEARQYKVKILVGTTKLLSVGTNIPRASCLYDVSLSSNEENCEQRNRRTLTKYEGKPYPILRIFLDDMSVRKRCLAMEYWKIIKPLIKPIITEEDEAILKQYLADKKSASMDEDGVIW
jgi:superfamily II DNA or RNA helicase